MATCLWSAISELHDKLEKETTEWIERRKENEKSPTTDQVTGARVSVDRDSVVMATAYINANRSVISELAMMLVDFECEKKCCFYCAHRKIKDFTVGYCDNPKTSTGIVSPDGYCDFFSKK